MRQILVLGAGRSSTILIKYLLDVSSSQDLFIRVGDIDLELAKRKVNAHDRSEAVELDINDSDQLHQLVNSSDLVISMLPSRFHLLVARVCLELAKHLVTASYINAGMKEMDSAAREKGLVFLNECGLDPGIDHMSGMKVIDGIRQQGGRITGFETFTGGLLAPSGEDNPWEYKFTWNPRNVVLAGQGGVKFIQEGRYKYIPYHRLFKRTEIIHIPKYGYFEGYANRDSLRYREVYGLEDVPTMYRGTLRRRGFCSAWDIFVQLGATDDSYEMEGVKELTHRQFLNSFLSFNPNDSIELKLAHYLRLEFDSEEMHKLKWLGLFDDELVGLDGGTPAQILEHILKKKWTLTPDDRDMIVMWHKLNYTIAGESRELNSTFVSIGEDEVNTAMARTVGLPMAIATKNILNGTITQPGVIAPISRDVYSPILEELLSMRGFEIIEEEKEANSAETDAVKG